MGISFNNNRRRRAFCCLFTFIDYRLWVGLRGKGLERIILFSLRNIYIDTNESGKLLQHCSEEDTEAFPLHKPLALSNFR